MYRKERQEEILALIRKQGYVSVEALTARFHYSPATINRDLNELQKQNLIKRSYGGAEPVVPQGIPHVFRYQKMRKSKRKISARAAAGSHISLLLFGMHHVFGLSRGFANATPTSLAAGFHSR